MNTWTCKGTALAGLTALSLAGCDPGAGVGAGASSGTPPLGEVPLSGGAVRVVMPFGYCIDPRSLREDFALAARCDTLGGQGPYGSLPLALITIMATPLPQGGPRPDMTSLKAGLNGAQILREAVSGTQPLILARDGTPPSPGLSATHWKSVFTAGGQVVALSLYAPEDSPALRGEGAALLRDLASGTRLATPAPVSGG